MAAALPEAVPLTGAIAGAALRQPPTGPVAGPQPAQKDATDCWGKTFRYMNGFISTATALLVGVGGAYKVAKKTADPLDFMIGIVALVAMAILFCECSLYTFCPDKQLQNQIRALQNQNAQITAELSQLKVDKEVFTNDLAQLRQQLLNETTDKEKLQQRLDAAIAHLTQVSAELKQTEQSFINLNSQLLQMSQGLAGAEGISLALSQNNQKIAQHIIDIGTADQAIRDDAVQLGQNAQAIANQADNQIKVNKMLQDFAGAFTRQMGDFIQQHAEVKRLSQNQALAIADLQRKTQKNEDLLAQLQKIKGEKEQLDAKLKAFDEYKAIFDVIHTDTVIQARLVKIIKKA